MAMAGLTLAMLRRRLKKLTSAKGITLLAKKKLTIPKKTIKILKLFMARPNEIPVDFMAANS